MMRWNGSTGEDELYGSNGPRLVSSSPPSWIFHARITTATPQPDSMFVYYRADHLTTCPNIPHPPTDGLWWTSHQVEEFL